MSHARSEASPTPTKHRNGIIRALSSFSKPVEEWGVSNVPVLSTSVTPRRERTSATQSRRNSDSSRTTAPSPYRLDRADIFNSPSRVPPISPLSIATVSTFGGWISERVNEDDAVDDIFSSHNDVNSARRPSGNTSSHHIQSVTPSRHEYTIPKPPSVSLTGSLRRGLDTGIHPLRMNPPSPSPSLSVEATNTQDRQTSTITLSPSPSKILLPSTLSFDDTASKVSRETISTRRSRRTLLEVNIEAANNDIRPHDEEFEQKKEEPVGIGAGKLVSVDKHCSFPRDVGYVEAMRLWYEDKENEALETCHRHRKDARRAGTASCALTSMNANQRL
ncbi:uncharacterized protein M421DRAFT_401026 [Didymella exigua CBS 183.55]|uniref:Uncharacterized protein n=1 Tax=Didymella exigua CBS 183.55 TaxID=1150837 RepID=A0A6A5RD75_9PLEO|nr:uncharacterized protein M421DRAFT_401026 [Didymella exigua CBS 183.55]KAF1925054.1 hypothetical protein M421DRAFT_401026 [Didymella exigua CBS 183.55]